MVIQFILILIFTDKINKFMLFFILYFYFTQFKFQSILIIN